MKNFIFIFCFGVCLLQGAGAQEKIKDLPGYGDSLLLETKADSGSEYKFRGFRWRWSSGYPACERKTLAHCGPGADC